MNDVRMLPSMNIIQLPTQVLDQTENNYKRGIFNILVKYNLIN